MFGQSLDLRRKKKTDVNLHRDLQVTVTMTDPSTTECPLQTEHRVTTLSSDLSLKGFSRGQRPVKSSICLSLLHAAVTWNQKDGRRRTPARRNGTKQTCCYGDVYNKLDMLNKLVCIHLCECYSYEYGCKILLSLNIAFQTEA